MLLGLLQLAVLGVTSFFMHYAARCAARSYVVYSPQGAEAALQRAELSANHALRWCRPRPTVVLEMFEAPLSVEKNPRLLKILLHGRLSSFIPLKKEFLLESEALTWREDLRGSR